MNTQGQKKSGCSGPALLIGCGGLLVLLIAGVGAFVLVIPRLGDADDAALRAANQCSAATAAIGDDIDHRLGFSNGSTQMNNSMGTAHWRMPVAGNTGNARYEWSASRINGTWTLTSGILTPESGPPINVLTCTAGAAPTPIPQPPVPPPTPGAPTGDPTKQ